MAPLVEERHECRLEIRGAGRGAFCDPNLSMKLRRRAPEESLSVCKYQYTIGITLCLGDDVCRVDNCRSLPSPRTYEAP